jgi:hypothetical protein
MALMLSIKWGIFFVGNIIGLALPINLLGIDGLRQRGGGGYFFVISWIYSLLFQFFLFFWKLLLGDNFLGCSLPLFAFLFGPFFWLIGT